LIDISNVIRDFRILEFVFKNLDKNNQCSTIIFHWSIRFCIWRFWFDWFDWLLVFRSDLFVNHDCFFCRWFMQIRLELLLDLMSDFLLDWFKIT
jgi:hypothetical protein